MFLGNCQSYNEDLWRVQQTICVLFVLYKAGNDHVRLGDQKVAKMTLLYGSNCSVHIIVIRLKSTFL